MGNDSIYLQKLDPVFFHCEYRRLPKSDIAVSYSNFSKQDLEPPSISCGVEIATLADGQEFTLFLLARLCRKAIIAIAGLLPCDSMKSCERCTDNCDITVYERLKTLSLFMREFQHRMWSLIEESTRQDRKYLVIGEGFRIFKISPDERYRLQCLKGALLSRLSN